MSKMQCKTGMVNQSISMCVDARGRAAVHECVAGRNEEGTALWVFACMGNEDT